MFNYLLAPLTATTVLSPGTLYIDHTPGSNSLRYKMLKADGTQATGTMTSEELGVNIEFCSSIHDFNALLSELGEILEMQGQIDAEVSDVFEINTDGNRAQLGVNVTTWEDPCDSSYVFLGLKCVAKKLSVASPRQIVILADVSGSMEGIGISSLQEALRRFFELLSDDDYVHFLQFSNTVTPLFSGLLKAPLGLPSPRVFLNMKVDALRAGGGTALKDAILTVGDKALIPGIIPSHATAFVFTDGKDEHSVCRASVDEVIKKYGDQFAGTPPRMIPVGLGAHYAYQFMRDCAVATNYGMINATNLAELPAHVKLMLNALAYGLHVTVDFGDAAPVHLGVINYDTINHQAVHRVKKSDLLRAGGIKITINGVNVCVDSAHFKPAGALIQANRVQPYLIAQSKKIYNTSAVSMTIQQKFDAINALLTDYETMLRPATEAQLNELLVILDKKKIVELVERLVSGYHDMTLAQAVVDKAKRDGTLTSLPVNGAYMDEVIRSVIATTGMHSSLYATVSHAVGVTGIVAASGAASSGHQRYVGASFAAPTPPPTASTGFEHLSSLRSSHFTLNMSTGGGGAGIPVSASELRLHRDLDFTKLPARAIVRSEATGRELLILTTAAPYMTSAVAACAPIPCDSLVAWLKQIGGYVCRQMPNRDLSVLGAALEEGTVCDMQRFLTAGVGVSRHHSLLMAGLVGTLVQTKLNAADPAILRLGALKVTAYRALTSSLMAHSCVLVTQTKEGIVQRFIIDPTLDIHEPVVTQADFERCVALYNSKDKYWFLRAFAADHGFVYPACEDTRAITGYPIIRMNTLAVLQPRVMEELRALGIIPAGKINIVQTDANRPALWKLLIDNGCIIPEELNEEQLGLIMAASRLELGGMPASDLGSNKACKKVVIPVLPPAPLGSAGAALTSTALPPSAKPAPLPSVVTWGYGGAVSATLTGTHAAPAPLPPVASTVVSAGAGGAGGAASHPAYLPTSYAGGFISIPGLSDSYSSSALYRAGCFETIGRRTTQEDACCMLPIADADCTLTDPGKIGERMWTTYHLLNEELRKRATFSGTTASATLVINDQLITATLADADACMIILDGADAPISVHRLNRRVHKPTDLTEHARIVAAGGYVIGERVAGGLAVSRAIGDFTYTGLCADADIDVTTIPSTAVKVLVVNGCDGLFDGAGPAAQTKEGHEAYMMRALLSINGGRPGALDEAALARALGKYAFDLRDAYGYPIVGDNISVVVRCVKSAGVLSPHKTAQAVFDGHGGTDCSHYAANNFHKVLVSQLRLSEAEYQAQPFSVRNKSAQYERDNRVFTPVTSIVPVSTVTLFGHGGGAGGGVVPPAVPAHDARTSSILSAWGSGR